MNRTTLLLTGSYGLFAAAALAAADKAGGSGKAAAPVEVGGFTLDTGLSVPPRTRFGGDESAPAYPFKEMPIGSSFLLDVTVPETIKDEKEREKAAKEGARKLSNKISGAIRRFRKANPGYNFAIRTVNDDTLGRGVRVWRVEAEDSAA